MVAAREDPVFGHLRWEDEFHWWTGETDLTPGQRIEFFIDFEEENSEAEILSQARVGLKRLRDREPEYRQWTSARLVERRWNKDEPMTVADITELLRVASILFLQDGRAKIYWDDDDVLFAGHNVTTELDVTGQCVSAGME